MRCAFCSNGLAYIHGHAACVDNRCPMYGLNQAECCGGERGDCLPTSAIARAPSREQEDQATEPR